MPADTFRIRKLSRRAAVFGTAMASMMAAGSAEAQEKIRLRMADIFPVGHVTSSTFGVPFAEQVKAELGDQVEIQYYPNNQLGPGRELLGLTVSGAADIAVIVPGFTPEKLPRSSVVDLPGLFPSACAGIKGFYPLAKSGILKQLEYDRAGIYPLVLATYSQYQFFLSSPIESIDSFKGKKIYSSGLAKNLLVEELGAASVRISSADSYEAMARRTIDGVNLGYASAASYKLQDQATHATDNDSFGSGVLFYGIGLARWKSLPDNVKEVFERVGKKISYEGCESLDRQDAAKREEMKAAGVKMVSLLEKDPDRTRKVIDSVTAKWVAQMDRNGLDGTKVLAEFKAALTGN